MARAHSIHIGETYNRLTATRNLGLRGKFTFFEFKCLCGTVIERPGYVVANNNTKSCGCLKLELTSELGKLFRLDKGQAALGAVIQYYKNTAKRRGLPFSLPKEKAISLILSKCHYCGAPPANRFNTKRYFGGCLYMGIDRIDNDRGYHEDNVVPCCKTCNLAKRDHSLAEFENWIERVHKHLMTRRSTSCQ